MIIGTAFLLQISYGILAIYYEKVVEIELNSSVNETFLMNYGIDRAHTTAIDFIQQKVLKNFPNLYLTCFFF